MNYDYMLKVVVCGPAAAGKTTLVQRYVYGTYDPVVTSTIGVDLFAHTVEYNGSRVRLQIWDTSGMEKFACLADSYYRHAHVVILVLDGTSARSAVQQQEYTRTIKSFNPTVPIVTVVNKTDLYNQRFGAQPDIEVSAVKGWNVSATFDLAVRLGSPQWSRPFAPRKKKIDPPRKCWCCTER